MILPEYKLLFWKINRIKQNGVLKNGEKNKETKCILRVCIWFTVYTVYICES